MSNLKPNDKVEHMIDGSIAYCGVDCSACPDYLEGKCPSCRQTDWQTDDACMPVECCQGKGISCCGECEVFPCEDMREFYNESESHGQAYQLMESIRTQSQHGKTD